MQALMHKDGRMDRQTDIQAKTNTWTDNQASRQAETDGLGRPAYSGEGHLSMGLEVWPIEALQAPLEEPEGPQNGFQGAPGEPPRRTSQGNRPNLQAKWDPKEPTVAGHPNS